MNQNEMQLLAKLGIDVTDVSYEYPEPNPYNGSYGFARDGATCRGTFVVNEEQFIPMCRLIKIVDMICESKNPQINEQFNHLVTMLFLTEDKKNG